MELNLCTTGFDFSYYNVEIGFLDPHTCSHSAGLLWSRDLKVDGGSRTLHAHALCLATNGGRICEVGDSGAKGPPPLNWNRPLRLVR
jgi:hypothetical protein